MNLESKKSVLVKWDLQLKDVSVIHKLFVTLCLCGSFSVHFNAWSQIKFQVTLRADHVTTGWDVKQCNDKGYIIMGESQSFGSGSTDLFITKTNERGNILWSENFGGKSSDYGRSVLHTKEGGYIIAGYTFSFGAGESDIYIIKINDAGDLLWSKTYGGIHNDYAYDILETKDRGFLILGETKSFGAGSFDVFLIKIDTRGNLQWSKTYGGRSTDVGRSIIPTKEGGYIIVGESKSFGAGDFDFYLIKIDKYGKLKWTKTYGGTGKDYGRSIQQTITGGYIISGSSFSFGHGGKEEDAYLIKTDAYGKVSWSKIIGGKNPDYALSVLAKNDEYIISGYTDNYGHGEADVFLSKLNSSGSIIWYKTYGGTNTDYGFCVQKTADQGFIIIGESSNYGAKEADVYLIKTDQDGNSGGCNEKKNHPKKNFEPDTITKSGGVEGNANPISKKAETLVNKSATKKLKTIHLCEK
ncbi:MAG: hypothetical protein FVQ77_01945 [Cytophagales bacterium]|nr:hypothetical protein [Cytophagales bacterium]